MEKEATEEWRDVSGYDAPYQVSSLGRVKSLPRKKGTKGKVLSPGMNTSGYEVINLLQDGRYRTRTVHRLVAIAFIANPENKRCVNHKDGDKTNNSIDNLEWATHKENTRHAFDTGLMVGTNLGKFRGEHNQARGVINTETGERYTCIMDAADATGINYFTLAGMLSGRRPNRTNLVYS